MAYKKSEQQEYLWNFSTKDGSIYAVENASIENNQIIWRRHYSSLRDQIMDLPSALELMYSTGAPAARVVKLSRWLPEDSDDPISVSVLKFYVPPQR